MPSSSGLTSVHCSANAVAEIPCRLVGDSKDALQLIGAHTLLRLTKKVDAQEPLPQGKVRVIEDRSSGDSELIAAIVAIKLVASLILEILSDAQRGHIIASGQRSASSTRGTCSRCRTAQSECRD